MLQLFPCLLRLRLTADPLARARHQKRQGLLLQHVRPGLHLSECPTPRHPQPPGPEHLKSAVAAAVYVPVLVFLQETYLMKHMSKHTMVEHLVCHRSPVHGTDSPTIPLRISLI